MSIIDRSGTITNAATSQEVMPPSATRRGFIFENVSDATMWINFGVAATASQPSLQILTNTRFVSPDTMVPSGSLTVICASQGKAFAAKEW
jgi:hypothetical protein